MPIGSQARNIPRWDRSAIRVDDFGQYLTSHRNQTPHCPQNAENRFRVVENAPVRGMLAVMATWIVLLRGVNVGGRHKLPMAALRELLAEVGFENVQTYIQSGNIVLDSPDGDRESVAQSIRGAIEERFGFAPHTFVLDVEALDAAIAANPFPQSEQDPKAVHFFFLAEPEPSADLDGLRKLATQGEEFVLTEVVFYLHTPNGFGRSRLVERLHRFIRAETTARNYRSVMAIRELV